jgi:hypothetical protein
VFRGVDICVRLRVISFLPIHTSLRGEGSGGGAREFKHVFAWDHPKSTKFFALQFLRVDTLRFVSGNCSSPNFLCFPPYVDLFISRIRFSLKNDLFWYLEKRSGLLVCVTQCSKIEIFSGGRGGSFSGGGGFLETILFGGGRRSQQFLGCRGFFPSRTVTFEKISTFLGDGKSKFQGVVSVCVEGGRAEKLANCPLNFDSIRPFRTIKTRAPRVKPRAIADRTSTQKFELVVYSKIRRCLGEGCSCGVLTLLFSL